MAPTLRALPHYARAHANGTTEHGPSPPSTQNQAFNALVFLYGPMLERPLGELAGVVRARKPRRLPVVLSREEVERLLFIKEGATLGDEPL